MLGLTLNDENSILTNEIVNAIINFLIVFGLALIPELLAHPGIPTLEVFYHAFLVGLLSALIFAAGNRGIKYMRNQH